MRLTLRYLALLGTLLLFSSFFLPAFFNGSYPHSAGPSFDRNATRQYLREFEKVRPEVILLGDSILTKGVDLETFQALSGKSAYKLDIPGSSSALWYLLVNSNIVEAEPAPQALVILFRDTILTAPTFRTTGPYFDLIDKFASPDDTLVLQRSYLVQLTPMQAALEMYFPPYSYRGDLRDKLDAGLRHVLPRQIGCDRECADDAMTNVLGDMRAEVVASSIRGAESAIYTPAYLDFNAQVDASYLPEIIRLAQKRGIQLIFVRAPTYIFPDPADEPPALKQYLADMEAYLAARDIPLIDLSQVQGIGLAQFIDPHHMSPEGKAIFTPVFAEAVKTVLK
ncbi:MAG: hypothetical protein HY869_20780 [Chloroflexi bacterium]|nr:hypothetical protein [Chloroflexota bacterium]